MQENQLVIDYKTLYSRRLFDFDLTRKMLTSLLFDKKLFTDFRNIRFFLNI